MVGIDLVFIPEFKAQLEADKSTFIDKAFNLSEMTSRAVEHLAGLWAAKEAVIKAATVQPEKMTDIVLKRSRLGKVTARLGGQKFAVSISHHGEYAVAAALRIDK